MNILSYLRKYGDRTFGELPFNEVDAGILAELSYVNFDLVAPTLDRPKSRMLKLHRLVMEDWKSMYRGSVDSVSNARMVTLMKKSKRFRDCKIGFCQNLFDKEQIRQFFAMTIFLPNGEAYVSFRGTDTSLLGWREDFEITYKDAIPSQIQSVEYIRQIAPYLPERFYLGGHSKGGNLAAYAALNMGEELEGRVIRVYSFDGPGFRTPVTGMASYQRLRPKLSKFLTKNDVIGLVYNVSENTRIVVSTGLMFGGHDIFMWKIKRDAPEFKTVPKVNSTSRRNAWKLMKWLNSMSASDKELLVNFLFHVFERRENVFEFIVFGPRDLIEVPKVLRQYSEQERKRLKKMLFLLADSFLRPDKGNQRRPEEPNPPSREELASSSSVTE